MEKTTEYSVYSNSEGSISLVAGTRKTALGIVLNEKEFLLCDYKGTQLNRLAFEDRIVFLDMIDNYVLLGFENNHVELFYIDNERRDLISNQSFEHKIDKAELTDWRSNGNAGVIVLLENGELWKSNAKNPTQFELVTSDAKTASYNFFSEILVYVTNQNRFSCFSYYEHDYSSIIPQTVIEDIQDIMAVQTRGYLHLNTRFLATGEKDSYYIQLDRETNAFSVGAVVPNEDMVKMSLAKTIPEAVAYRENDQWFYEGPSHNERRVYGEGEQDRIRIPAAKDYIIHTVLGGVVCYNEHEMRIILVN